MSYLKSMTNTDCNEAILRIFNKINLIDINNFIDNIEGMSKSRKEFYKNILKYRYEILKNIYKKLTN